tara:strand:- start:11961 stop:12110 length:150 start_codon:yes stop_codon:yes gene_type:complete
MSRFKINNNGDLMYDPAYDSVLKGMADNKLFIEGQIEIMKQQLNIDDNN